MAKSFHRPCLSQLGFSLIEFLTVIAIMSIVFAFAVPSFREMELSMDRGRSVRQLEADIRKVQGIGLSRGLRAILQFDSTGSSYSVGLDYAPYSETGVADEILERGELPSTVSMMTSASPIIFDSRGYLINHEGNFTSVELYLRQDGAVFLSGHIPPNGFLSFDTREGHS